MHAKLLSNTQVTNPGIVTIFTRAGIQAQIDNDGDCLAMIDNVKVFARSEPDHNVIRVFSGWNLRPEATPAQVLALCNRINTELVHARASYREPSPVLWFDWFIDTSAGISDAQLVANARRLRSVMGSAIPQDTERILK